MDSELTIRRVNGVCVMDVAGHIVLGKTSKALHDKIEELLSNDEHRIIMNLAAVTYVDSCGMGEFVRSSTMVANRGGKLKLFNVPRRVNDLMRLSGITQIFEIFEDEGKAIASFP